MFSYLNTHALDNTQVDIRTNLPVYISMSTIPSRMGNTFKIIEHTLKQVKGDLVKLILNVPHKYKRFPNFNVDNELQRHNKIKDPRFMLNRTNDLGPLTKFLPSLEIIPDESILIICDDMCYKLEAYKDIAERQDANLNKSFSFYVYNYVPSSQTYHGEQLNNGIAVPQGADMISFYTHNARTFPTWFAQFLAKTKTVDYFENPCFWVDDEVIGFFLQEIGIPLVQVDPTHRMIYIRNCDMAPLYDNLNKQTGRASRDTTMENCSQELYRAFS
jgi:hypothetical protein